MYYAIDDDMTQLEHHGILGQKWGVRRFQRADGTLTPAGKNRIQDGSSNRAQNGDVKKGIDKEKLKTAAKIGVGVAVGAALIANPATRNVLTKYGKTALDNLPGAMAKVGTVAGKGAGKLMNKTSERASKVGDAMIDAALLSIGGIAISEVTEKLAVDENASKSEKYKSQVLTNTITKGIESATGAGNSKSSNSSGGNKGGNVGKEVVDKLGAPTKRSIDKQSAEWQNLFKDSNGNQLDAETRGTIKALASQGYDLDQIKQYKREFGHADIHEWIGSIISDPTRW